MIKLLYFSIISIMVISCNEPYKKEYQNAKETLNALEKSVEGVTGTTNKREVKDILDRLDRLEFDYDVDDVRRDETKAEYEKLSSDIRAAKEDIPQRIEDTFKGMYFVIFNKSDYLMESTEAITLHASKGDTIVFNLECESPSDVKWYNADARKLLKSFPGKTTINETFVAPNTAIYIFEVNPRETQYVDMFVGVEITSLQQVLDFKTVETEMVSCGKTDFRAVPIEAIRTREIFEEPRQHTLRSQLKSVFSGGDRALVAVEIPTGTTDILYSLRISTSQSSRSTDGKFKPNMDCSYHKIKFMGLPIYDSSRSSGIISMILDENVPYREEEAYCSMYVFYNSAQAKKFQDGTAGLSDLTYDVNNSKVGTQSCNGRINVKGKNVVYFGFLNERMRYQNYIWFEALASTKCIEYYNAKYTLIEPEINDI